mmetsp:Transcript_53430/g.119928  ORF Transcript_53430/g.119928 Transcript_53430/m.119928 type:complete len:83 (-) Transcript_53430:603-851(-)
MRESRGPCSWAAHTTMHGHRHLQPPPTGGLLPNQSHTTHEPSCRASANTTSTDDDDDTLAAVATLLKLQGVAWLSAVLGSPR